MDDRRGEWPGRVARPAVFVLRVNGGRWLPPCGGRRRGWAGSIRLLLGWVCVGPAVLGDRRLVSRGVQDATADVEALDVGDSVGAFSRMLCLSQGKIITVAFGTRCLARRAIRGDDPESHSPVTRVSCSIHWRSSTRSVCEMDVMATALDAEGRKHLLDEQFKRAPSDFVWQSEAGPVREVVDAEFLIHPQLLDHFVGSAEDQVLP